MLYRIKFVIFLTLTIFQNQLLPSQIAVHTTPVPSVVRSLAHDEKIKLNDKIKMFIQDCARDSVYNKNIPQHISNKGILRIMTYNVHFWMDPYFKGFRNTPDKQPVHQEMLNIIAKINPDVLVLQEVTLEGSKRFNLEGKNFREIIESSLEKMGYRHRVWQALIPGKNPGAFGNLIASKLPLKSDMHIYSADKDEKKEQRGYINVNVAGISLYGTHLDVWDETEQKRMNEMGELIKAMDSDTNPNVILMGDLNAVRKKDHDYEVNGKNAWDLLVADDRERLKFDTPTRTLDLLAANGYTDCFTLTHIPSPKYTVWSGKVVDFIMLKSSWKLPIAGCYAYYDATSDHIPLIIDIKIGTQSIARKVLNWLSALIH